MMFALTLFLEFPEFDGLPRSKASEEEQEDEIVSSQIMIVLFWPSAMAVWTYSRGYTHTQVM